MATHEILPVLLAAPLVPLTVWLGLTGYFTSPELETAEPESPALTGDGRLTFIEAVRLHCAIREVDLSRSSTLLPVLKPF